jgi:hypothetical protein
MLVHHLTQLANLDVERSDQPNLNGGDDRERCLHGGRLAQRRRHAILARRD